MGLPAIQMRFDSEGLALNELVYLPYLETWLNAQWVKRLSELLDRALHLLIRGIAAVARLALGHESLPKNR
jgi:hypothetical protein